MSFLLSIVPFSGEFSFWKFIGSLFLVYIVFALRYPDRAFGTTPRYDLLGPAGLPIVGNTLRVMRFSKKSQTLDNLLLFHEQTGEPGTTTLLGVGRIITINRPDWVEYVQATNFANYTKGEYSYRALHDILGEGIFNADGETWKYQRKVASRGFSVAMFREIAQPILESELNVLEGILDQHARSGTPFDLQDLFFRFTLSAFVRMAFGTDIGSLSRPESPHEFAEAFDMAQDIASRRFEKPGWKFWERFNKQGRQMRAAIKVINDTIEEIVSERLRTPRAQAAGRKDLLQLFLEYRHEKTDPRAGQGLTKTELRDVLVNLLLAGRDTTAESLSWACFRLMQNPAAARKLSDEAHEQELADRVDYDGTKRLKWTKAVYFETLRLHPSVPRQSKIAVDHDVIPNGGPRIEPGDVLAWSDWVMARSRSVWGPDARTWRPDRWFTPDGEVKNESQWKFHVFNGGPRLCLGAQLAQFQALSVLSRIFGKYEFEFVGDMPTADKAPAYYLTLTLPMRDPLNVCVSKRVQ